MLLKLKFNLKLKPTILMMVGGLFQPSFLEYSFAKTWNWVQELWWYTEMSKRDDFFRKGERGRRQRERSTNESLGKMECCKERKGGQNNNFKIMLLFNKLFIIFITIDFSHSYNILINPMACNSGPLNSPKPKRNNVSATCFFTWVCSFAFCSATFRNWSSRKQKKNLL